MGKDTVPNTLDAVRKQVLKKNDNMGEIRKEKKKALRQEGIRLRSRGRKQRQGQKSKHDDRRP